jgi:DNA-binding transcriptional LysR family regulator
MHFCMMDLDLLGSFLAVHRAGSLSAAARVVGKSQPALSRQLQALEARTGRPLFARVGRGLRPTPAGDDLARAIAGPLDALALAFEANDPAATTGTVHIGGPVEVLSAWALPTLAPLVARGLSVAVRLLPSDAALDGVARGELDVAISAGRRRAGLQLTRLFTEELVLVASTARARLLSGLVQERGANALGGALIALATLAWGIDNNISQRLSLRDPIQIATLKAAGAALPMLALALLLGHPLPPPGAALGLLVIGALGYGISIWLDLLALRALGAAREAVLFSTAPFVGALFALAVLGDRFTPPLLIAAALMAAGVLLLLQDKHSHRHQHTRLRHAHRHRHDPDGGAAMGGDPHHVHPHRPEDQVDCLGDHPYWHAHAHEHEPLEHDHPHSSDAHHRHQH